MTIVIQEYFQERVRKWPATVGKHVFKIKHYWLRYEFAPIRGQIHCHMLAITENSLKQMRSLHSVTSKCSGSWDGIQSEGGQIDLVARCPKATNDIASHIIARELHNWIGYTADCFKDDTSSDSHPGSTYLSHKNGKTVSMKTIKQKVGSDFGAFQRTTQNHVCSDYCLVPDKRT